MSLSKYAEIILKNTLDALQDAEEMGGVRDMDDYIALMKAVKEEVQKRIINAVILHSVHDD